MNRDIKIKIFSAGLKQWQIAKELGIDEGAFSKKINREKLNDSFLKKIDEAINRLKKEEF